MAYDFFGFSSSSSSSSSSKTLVERDFISLMEERDYKGSGVNVALSLEPPPFPVKKCFDCERIYTPMWRNGPQGPKTLCNACGLRYRKESMRIDTNLTLGPAKPISPSSNLRRNRA